MLQTTSRERVALVRSVPRELINILGTALGIFLTVMVGGFLASALPDDPSPWLFAGCYVAPAAACFAIYWFIAQKL